MASFMPAGLFEFKIKLFSLNRISFGSIYIGDLKLGESRLLSEKEINRLKKAV